MSTNLTLEDIEHIKALVDQIDLRATEYCRDNSPDKAGWLGSAVAKTKEFLNGYAAALKHIEKKEEAA
jgi:hypothetical protein